jgi:hypothetical protein
VGGLCSSSLCRMVCGCVDDGRYHVLENGAMRTRIFQNNDGTYCVRQGPATWLFIDVRVAEQFYRALKRG